MVMKVIRMMLFLIGFGLMVIGSVYLIMYLNLLSMGLNFNNYLVFVSKRLECYFLPIGFIITSLVIFTKGKEYDLYL